MKNYKVTKERICEYCECIYNDKGEPIKYGNYGYICIDCYVGLCN